MNGARRSEGLSIFAAIAFAVGNMVGAGVFVLSGLMIDKAGPAVTLSYLICGILVTFSGLSYAALASIFPEDGGGFLYAEHMLGRYLGFMAGWSMYISEIVVTSFVLLGLGIYLNLLIGIDLDHRLGALTAIILLTILNLRGLSEAGKIEVILVMTKVIILTLLVVVGLLHINRSDFVPFMPHGQGAVVDGITTVFFAYIGFQVVAMMGGEIKGASKNVPIATLASIGIVAALYIGVIQALLSAKLPSYGSESVFDAAVVLLGAFGGTIVAIAAVISTLSAANANIIGASRVILEMASEGQIPGRFARLTNGQPLNSVLLGSTIVTVLIIYGSLSFIVNLTNVLVLITMLLVNISAFALVRETKSLPPEKSYFKIPLGIVFPALGAVSCLAMLATIDAATLMLGFAALIAGMAFYFVEDTSRGKESVIEIKRMLGR
jgi:APA family basic amino acid/polyamine antiporter